MCHIRQQHILVCMDRHHYLYIVANFLCAYYVWQEYRHDWHAPSYQIVLLPIHVFSYYMPLLFFCLTHSTTFNSNTLYVRHNWKWFLCFFFFVYKLFLVPSGNTVLPFSIFWTFCWFLFSPSLSFLSTLLSVVFRVVVRIICSCLTFVMMSRKLNP